MQQSKRHSLYETITSTTVGFIVAFLLNLWVLPWFMKVQPTHAQNFGMVVIFTIVSVIRGYGMRRFFNWLGWRKRLNISVLTVRDHKFLHWLYERYLVLHGEHPDTFYMKRLKEIVDNSPEK